MVATRAQEVGKVMPVDIAVSNGTSEPRLIEPSQVFALTPDGQEVIPIPAGEAIREAGSADSLRSALVGGGKGAAVGTAIGAVAGAGLGALVGAAGGNAGAGAAAGAAIGGGVGLGGGAVAGGVNGDEAAYHDATSQISALSLKGGEIPHNFSINGYVFFPEGNYKSVQMTLVNQETHDTDVIRSDLH